MTITATLIAQMVAFTFFVLFTMKFVWPPIASKMDERKKIIADGLAAAEKGAQAQVEAENEAQNILAEARNQAADIVGQAQKRGSEIIEQAKQTAVSEGDRLKESANAEIEAEKVKAAQELKGQVVSMSVAGAQKILEREINAETHKDFLEKFVSQL